MGFFAFVVAAFCFLIAALSPLFDWNLGDFHAIAWGLFALAVGFLLGHSGRHVLHD